MKKNSERFMSPAITAIAIVLLLSTGCTKADYGDDVVKGDAPPVPGGFTNSDQIAKANLVGYWAFNGSLIDSVSGTAGVATNTSFATGQKGQAMKGDVNGYVIAPASTAIKNMTAYTVSLWFNSPLNTGATGLFSLVDAQNFWGNINIFFENGGNSNLARVKTIYADNGTTRDNAIQDISGGFNKWVQYTISYDGAGVFKSFVNGSLIRTNTVTGMAGIRFLNATNIVFGALQFMTNPSSTTGSTSQPWAAYLTGQLDEVRVYNKALTDVEIFALFKLERQGR
jgi:hypothetical protein